MYKPEIPRFESESEEAQWWFDHREETALRMETAADEGQTTSLAAILQKRQAGSSAVSIDIDAADADRARDLAKRRGMPYRAFLKTLLHEALENESRRLAT